jgi:ABC-type nitrate/sulfonate/bicarbonate transport system substrate-binding protein
MPEQLELTTALLSHGQTDALRDGRVTPRGITLRHVEVNPPPMIYRRMVRALEFDVAEVAMTTFLCAKSLGKPISALPVFSNRDLTLTPIVSRAGLAIHGPKDLEGKRVGMRSFTETNTTQTRALLRSEFGLDTDRVQWVISEDAHVAEYEPPANVEMIEGADLGVMLRSGEIDALMAPRLEPGAGQKLLLSPEQAETAVLSFYRRTGVYPIGHLQVVRDDVVAANPSVVADLFQAFKESKLIYLNEVDKRSKPNDRDRQVIRNRKLIGGDPLPYGLDKNRAALEAAVAMNLDQHVIRAPLDVDSLFAPGSARLE